jgi:Sulfotransferase family
MTGRIVVLGMHRSGTSCMGELLAAMGAYFGPREMGTSGNVENPHGLFERRDLRHLCHFMLQRARAEWWATSNFSPDRLSAAALSQLDAMLAPMLTDLDAHEPWFVKEPRLCILLPMLRARLGEIVAVCMWRDPVEVAESLRTRDAIPIEFGLALWERYVRASFAAGVPSAMVSYNQLVAEPELTTRKLLQDLSALGVTGLRMPDARQLAQAVDPALRRSRPHREVTDMLSASQRRLLAALRAGNPADPELAAPMSADRMTALAAFERARRMQMKTAAYRSLAEARSSCAAVPMQTRLREIAGAFGYLPYNPVRWVRWLRRGKLRRRLREHLDAFAIALGGGFDRQWYVTRYRDVAKTADPLMHFVRYGASEGRDPSPSHPTSRHLHAVLDAPART